NDLKGYLGAPEATAEALRGGGYHTWDSAVMHPAGDVPILDRAKDIVISVAEDITTLEVEQAIAAHEFVSETSVEGMPDDKWGQRPLAYVVLGPGADVDEAGLIAFVKTRIASYKAPSAVEFVDALPTTSTGKIRKNALRELAQG